MEFSYTSSSTSSLGLASANCLLNSLPMEPPAPSDHHRLALVEGLHVLVLQGNRLAEQQILNIDVAHQALVRARLKRSTG